jgi:hypothetical protein
MRLGMRRPGILLKVALVSPGVVAMAEGQLGFTAGLLMRDPDGHAMQVIER